MGIYEVAALISLALTPVTVILCVAVVAVWGPLCRHTLQNRKTASDVDWLILGLSVGFVASIADNIWWGVAWSTAFIEGSTNGLENWWFKHGTFSNIVFRQGGTMLAAILHLRSAVVRSKLSWSYIAAANFIVAMLFIAVLGSLR